MELSPCQPELVAPCGLNCALCSGYQALANHVPAQRGRPHCAGCRPRGKGCAYLKGRCPLIGEGRVAYCSDCPTFPCERLRHLDARYRTRWHASPIANLRSIKANGLGPFLVSQYRRYRCPRCGGLLVLQDGQCYHCGNVPSWQA